MRATMTLLESFRRLRRSPRLSIAVVLCIALGMAATAAVATLISLTQFRPLPFPDSERLVRIWNTESGSEQRDSLAPADLVDLREGLDTLDRLEAAARSRLIWHLPGRAGRRVEGEAITNGYLELLAVDPFIGRTFTPAEYASGEPLMLLSYAAWSREFGHDESVLGRGIRTSTQYQGVQSTYTVIGVLPPNFHGTIEDDMPDLEFWVPMRAYFTPADLGERRRRGVLAVGRLAAGASVGAAQEEASSIAAALSPEFEGFAEDHDFLVEPLGANWRAGFSRANGLLSGAAGMLLAIAVLNVAMLLVARTLERRHELAVRAALGASRGHLVSPLLGETLLLSLIGGSVGLLVAGPALDAFLGLSGTRIPDYLDIRPDAATLVIAFALMLGAGMAAALLPAWAATRVDVNDVLREGSSRLSGSRTASRWGRWMVGGQIAMTLSLLLAGALLARSWIELEREDLGFATENRLRMGLFISNEDVPDDAALPAFVEEVERALKNRDGVGDVAMLWPTVPMPNAIVGRLQWPDMPEQLRDPGLRVSNYIVADGFFQALEIPLVAGRSFDGRERRDDAVAEDSEAVRSAIVGRSLAESLGGPAAALEREVELNGQPYRIVGVVGDTKFGGPDQNAEFEHQMYLSFSQLPRRIVSPIVEVSGDPAAQAERLKQVLAEVAPNSAVDWVEPVDEFLGWLNRDSAFRLALVAAFGLSALILAAVGLYAVLAQQVSAATTEIGLRKALGASDRRILLRVIRRGLLVTGGGVLAGLVLAVASSRVLEGLLHGVDALDPAAYAAAIGTLLLVATAACLLPALGAARVAPMEALRHE